MDVYEEMVEEYLSWPRKVLELELPEIPRVVRWKGKEIPYDDCYDVVIVSGMGGSGIVGDSVATVCSLEQCNALVLVVKDYYVPPLPRGVKALMLSVSYSGNTEETLMTTYAALTRRIPVIGITSGGRLSKVGIPVVKVPEAKAPRLGYAQMVEAALRVLDYYGVVNDRVNSKSLRLDENLVELTSSKFSAGRPLVLVPSPLASAGHRLKSELNENAKLLVHYEVIPEAHHNLATALEVDKPSSILVLSHDRLRLYHKLRVEATAKLLKDLGVEHFVINMPNTGSVATDLVQFALNIGVASVRLAKSRGVDPFIIKSVDLLKEFMSSRADLLV